MRTKQRKKKPSPQRNSPAGKLVLRGRQHATVNPPIKCHGGKGYLAPTIHRIAQATSYLHRVITHAGGLGEAWNWSYDGISEVVNDIDGNLTNFYEVLANEKLFHQLRRKLEATPFSQPLFKKAHAFIHATVTAKRDKVEWAYQFFIVARQSMAGRQDCFAPISRNRTRRDMNEQVSAWLTAIEGLDVVHQRAKRFLILNADCLKVIKQQDGTKTLYYIDPPYLPETRTAHGVYRHEMTYEQHDALLQTLAKIKGKFILSGYDSALYRRYEKQHKWHRVVVDLPNNAASGKTKKRMREVLWTNFDPKMN